jgi:hypothetical protein
VLEDLPDFFKSHLRSLREAEVDKDPTNGAKTCVEAEGARGCHVLHHAEERSRHHNVRPPVKDVNHLQKLGQKRFIMK